MKYQPEVRSSADAVGRVIYDDGVARAVDLGDNRFALECSGRSIECDALDIVEAATALISRVGGKLSVLEAVRRVLFDIEDRLEVEA